MNASIGAIIELQETAMPPQQVLNCTVADCAYLRKCGEITVCTTDEQCFWLNCAFCQGICLQYDVFIEHIREQHGQDIKALHGVGGGGAGDSSIVGVAGVIVGGGGGAADDVSDPTAIENTIAMDLGVEEQLGGGLFVSTVNEGAAVVGGGGAVMGVVAKMEQATRPQSQLKAPKKTTKAKKTTTTTAKAKSKARTMTRTTIKTLRTRSMVSLSMTPRNNNYSTKHNHDDENTAADSGNGPQDGKRQAKPTRKQLKRAAAIGVPPSNNNNNNNNNNDTHCASRKPKKSAGTPSTSIDKVNNSASNTRAAGRQQGRRGRQRRSHASETTEGWHSDSGDGDAGEKVAAALTVKNAQLPMQIPQEQEPRRGVGAARRLQQQQVTTTTTTPTAAADSAYLMEAAAPTELQGEMEMTLLVGQQQEQEEEGGGETATVDPFEQIFNAVESAANVTEELMAAQLQNEQNVDAFMVGAAIVGGEAATGQAAEQKPALKRCELEHKVWQPTRREVFRNRELIATIIDAYKSNEKLWNPKHPHYKYNAKRSVFNELSEPLLRERAVQLSGGEIFAVLRELKCRYRQELAKCRTLGGCSSKQKARLWYFDKFEFLRHLIEHKRADREAKLHLIAVAAKKPLTEQQKTLLRLLTLYEGQAALWNTKHKDYSACNRTQLYAVMAGQLSAAGAKTHRMNGKECEGALQKLRQRFRNELSRMNRCKGLYTPKLWCFDAMQFLREFDEAQLELSLCKKRQTRLKTSFLKADSIAFASAEQRSQFIEIYRRHTALWQVDHPDYRSNTYRTKALLEMLAELTGSLGISATLEQLQKTLYQMRKDYAAEKQKRLLSSANGAATPGTPSTDPSHSKLAEFIDSHLGPFRCEVCAALIKTCDKYKIHKSGHDGTAPFVCTICGRGFQMQGNLTIHIRRHKRDFPYSCGVCEKRCATSTEVSIHMRTHTGERPYICHLCGKSFKTYSFFDVHQRMHRQQSNFHCPICERDFYEKNRFTDHMNRHLNIRKHSCAECGKSYTTAANLRKHQELHSIVKKYKCDECGTHCAQSASLRWHKRKVHGRAAINNEQ